MRLFYSTILVLLLAAGSVFAQGFGGNEVKTIMLNTDKGLFALRTGVLAKYNMTTLKQEAILPLFGPAPEAPKNFQDRTAFQNYMTEMQRRSAAAIMLAKDTSLLIVIGDGFARINQDTLTVEATGELPASTQATTDPNAGGWRPRQPEAEPAYLLVDTTLYLMRSKDLVAISITDGKCTSVDLAKDLLPTQLNLPMGGGGNTERGNGNNGGGWRQGGPQQPGQ